MYILIFKNSEIFNALPTSSGQGAKFTHRNTLIFYSAWSISNTHCGASGGSSVPSAFAFL